MKACNECPYRKESAPGWLGETSGQPDKFLRQLDCLFAHPCHKAVDWEASADEIEIQALDAPPCAGMIQFARNSGKMFSFPPLELLRRSLTVDDTEIFATRPDFLKHHTQ